LKNTEFPVLRFWHHRNNIPERNNHSPGRR
jgi:hypothetical protein